MHCETLTRLAGNKIIHLAAAATPNRVSIALKCRMDEGVIYPKPCVNFELTYPLLRIITNRPKIARIVVYLHFEPDPLYYTCVYHADAAVAIAKSRPRRDRGVRGYVL